VEHAQPFKNTVVPSSMVCIPSHVNCGALWQLVSCFVGICTIEAAIVQYACQLLWTCSWGYSKTRNEMKWWNRTKQEATP